MAADIDGRDCFHCGLPVPAGAPPPVVIDGEPRAMCCPGCEAVARLIVETGLGSYYRLRQGHSATAAGLAPEPAALASYDRPALEAELVRRGNNGERRVSIAVEDMRCAACCWLIESRLSRLPGVTAVRANLASERCDVEWRGDTLTVRAIVEEIFKLGYRAYPYRPDERSIVRRSRRRKSLLRLGVAGLVSMQVMVFATSLYGGALDGMGAGHRLFLRWVSALVTVPVVVFSAKPFFTGALRDFRNRRLGMDVPVAIAVAVGFAASLHATAVEAAEVYYDSVCMFVFFLLAGRHFEANSRDRAAFALESAVRSPPAIATRLLASGESETVAVAELAPGDCVLVKPGETFPVDGFVREGNGPVDEAMLTGEHWPREKRDGDAVVGGSQNGECPFVVDVTRAGDAAQLAAIVRLVETAAAAKPRIARVADGVAAWFVPGVLLCATGALWWWWPDDRDRAIQAALAVLVVTCPCALSLATPAALAAATGGILRRGFLIGSAHVLEGLAAASHVVFDKTGTLTRGDLKLGRVLPAGTKSTDACLALAAALEARSEHPVARAFARAGNPRPSLPAPRSVRNVAGKGIEAKVDGVFVRIGQPAWVAALSHGRTSHPAPDDGTWILLGDETGPICWFELHDTPRVEAAAAVSALEKRGIEVTVASGDRNTAVTALASRIGIANARGEMSPQDKLAYVEELQSGKGVVVMVGDGVNDAPGLGVSQVSIAMGGGTDLAVSRADAVVLREDLLIIVEALDHARKTRRVIRQNLAWATLYNLAAVPLAVLGWIPPYWAAAGMSASSLLVVGNAMRLAHVAKPARSGAGSAQQGAQRIPMEAAA